MAVTMFRAFVDGFGHEIALWDGSVPDQQNARDRVGGPFDRTACGSRVAHTIRLRQDRGRHRFSGWQVRRTLWHRLNAGPT